MTNFDVNAKNKWDATPLHWANTEQTNSLIQAGADVNAKNKDGKTPLYYAKTVEQTNALIQAGAIR